MSGRRFAGWVGLAVLFAAALRLCYWHGFVGMDDALYARQAMDLARRGLHLPEYFSEFRLGLLAPTALLYRWFGLSPLTTGLWPLLSSLGSIVLLAAIGRSLFGAPCGVLAAFLLASSPLDVSYSTYLYPGVPGAFFGLLAVAMAVVPGSESHRRFLFDLGAGLAAGLAYLVSEQSLLAIAFLLPFTIWQRRGWTRLAFAGGALLVFAAECTAYGLPSGDPLYRLHRTAGTYLDFVGASRYAGHLVERIVLAWPRLVLLPWSDGFVETGPVFLLALLAILGLPWWSRRRCDSTVLAWRSVMIVVAWLGLAYAYLALAAFRAPGLVPLLPVVSYLVPLVPPAALLCAAILPHRRTGRVALAAWISAGITLPALSPLGDDAETPDRAARALAADRRCPLHALTHSSTIVAYRYGFPADDCVREIDWGLPPGPQVRSGWVLLDRERLLALAPLMLRENLAPLQNPPPEWQLVGTWTEQPNLRARLRAWLGRSPTVTRQPTLVYRVDPDAGKTP